MSTIRSANLAVPTNPTRRVTAINDMEDDMPTHYSTTPGGTLYSTTPGGTRLVYDRSTLLNLRNSPLSKSPPTYDIPEGLKRNGHYNPKAMKVPQNGPTNNINNTNTRGTITKGGGTIKENHCTRYGKNNNWRSEDDEQQFHMEL